MLLFQSDISIMAKIFEDKMLYKYGRKNIKRTEALTKDTEMFVLFPGLVLASLLAPGTTQEFNGYFNAAAGGNSDDSCSRILCAINHLVNKCIHA